MDDRKSKSDYYLSIAGSVADRSTCLRRKYGAVIVNNDEIISTGYNGAPRGRKNCSDTGHCVRKELNIPSGERYEMCCLAGYTMVKLFDGTTESIEHLAKCGNDKFLVYAVDPWTGKPMMAEATNPMATKQVTSLIRVTFDDGGFIDCTPDHRIMMSEGNYREAAEFKPGDTIKAVCREFVAHDRMVQSVETIEYKGWVYDLSVPGYENFAVDIGTGSCIFVHNCSVHAEQNAIISAARRDMMGATLYLYGKDASGNTLDEIDCCTMCKRMIINAGISTVVFKENDHNIKYRIVSVDSWVKDDDTKLLSAIPRVEWQMGAIAQNSEENSIWVKKNVLEFLSTNESATVGDISDGYHTFNELYDHRAKLFITICGLLDIIKPNTNLVWKSKRHADGTMYDGMFIVGVNTPEGPATYHYDIDPYWWMFDVTEIPRAPEWDGHTPADAIERIMSLVKI